jgi:K+-sensing histidine kinase KdpD
MSNREEELLKKIEIMEAGVKEKIDYCRMLEEINSGLRKYLNEMTGVYRLLEAMNTIKSLNKIYDLLVDILGTTIAYDACAIYIYDDNGTDAKLIKSIKLDELKKYRDIFNVDNAMYEWVFKKKHIAVVPKGTDGKDEPGHDFFEGKSFAIAPLFANDKRIGYVDILISKPANTITQQELSLLTILLNQTTMIIENLRMYEQEKETVMKLKQIDEMKSDIMTTTSHELRTPLTILKGSSKIIEIKMKEDMWMDDDKKLYLELMHNVNTQAEILEEITNTLLAATKFENGTLTLNKKVSNIKQIIDGIIKKYSYKTKNINIKFFCSDPAITAFVDDDEIKKVVRNILSNACKYSAENGEVDITLTADEKTFMVSVKDHGPGVPADEKERIFDKFYRLDRALTRRTGGMGFGLYLSKMIVVQHGGTIWVESKPGEGASFIFRIPKNQGLGGY